MSSSSAVSGGSRDRIVSMTLRVAGLIAGLIVLLIIGFVFVEAWPALEAIGPTRFITDDSWSPTARNSADAQYGHAPLVIGSLASAFGAILFAGPLGLISAIFCQFYAPRLIAGFYRRLIELLAGIPSVVFGLWGMTTLIPIIARIDPPGASLLAGILIVTLMILPTIALLSEAAFRNIPHELLHASAALGLSRWRTILQVMLPASRTGIGVAVILGIARAIGETMAVLMVCGNVVQIPGSIFDPVRTLTANIALELGYSLQMHRSVLFVSGLMLMFVVVLLVLLSEFISRKSHEGRR